MSLKDWLIAMWLYDCFFADDADDLLDDDNLDVTLYDDYEEENDNYDEDEYDDYEEGEEY